MANSKHVEILKQGVDVWNKWRNGHRGRYGNLSGADLRRFKLQKADFVWTNLSGANLNQANLSESILIGTNFTGAILDNVDFRFAEVRHATFSETTMRRTKLFMSHFSATDFSEADLTFARMSGAEFINANFSNSVFNNASFGGTIFSECDLSSVKGLETTKHYSSSSFDLETLFKSNGKIPEVFLRKAGVPDIFMTYAKSLVENPIDFYSCFISFTEKDDVFSERLYNDMQAKGVRCWRWKEDAKWGRTLRKEIDEAVRYYDKLVVICSKDSLNSPAVLEEIERALGKEDAQRRNGDEGEVLFPIRIDDYIFNGWESELKVRLTKKNIGDFCDWNGDAEKYRKSVERLVRDLNRPRK